MALGRSLIRQPKILLLDEPLTNLDAKLRHDMRAELKRLHRQFGMTIVYATPDELEALSMGEEIAVMRDGAVVQRGTPDELYERRANLYVAGKIGSPHMNMIKGRLATDSAAFEPPLGPLPFAKMLQDRRSRRSGHDRHPPERHPPRGEGRARPQGQYRLLEPLGDVTIVSVEAGGETLRMVLPESAASGLQPGERRQIFSIQARFTSSALRVGR